MIFGGEHTAEARNNTFETELSAALDGHPMRMHVGLGPDTDNALITIALAHPDITDDMIATVRRAFAAESVDTDTVDTNTATEAPDSLEEPATTPGASL